MNCPRCHIETIEMQNNDIKIQVCMEGCSGIWFDPFIFKKMDEPHESDATFLKKLSQGPSKNLDLEQKINCPRCEKQPMFRRFFSVRRAVEIDECPACAGIWLDAGELTQIYSMFETEEQRKAEADQLLADLIGEDLEQQSMASEEELEKNRKIANALRFICPSYYFKDKTDWGNF